MHLELLTEQIWNRACAAKACLVAGEKAACLSALVELRELLNKQPELEAGGVCESPEPSKQ